MTHQIITNDERQFVAWPDSSKLPLGWRYVGKAGTKVELDDYLRMMMVDTAAAPLIVSDGRRAESQWG